MKVLSTMAIMAGISLGKYIRIEPTSSVVKTEIKDNYI